MAGSRRKTVRGCVQSTGADYSNEKVAEKEWAYMTNLTKIFLMTERKKEKFQCQEGAQKPPKKYKEGAVGTNTNGSFKASMYLARPPAR